MTGLSKVDPSSGGARVKRCALWLSTLAITLLVMEVLAHLVYRVYWDEWFEIGHLSATTSKDGQPKSSLLDSPHILHPYSGTTFNNRRLAMNRPPTKPDGDTFDLALFGGSVALQVRRELASQLQGAFDQRGINKTVQVHLFAAGGLKQPQQLMQLNFALSQGKKFDAVVNLDGYNESVLSIEENLRRGVSPFYPRLWDLTLETYYQRRLPGSNELKRRRERVDYYANLRQAIPFRYSASLALVSSILEERANHDLLALNHALKSKAPLRDLQHAGPRWSRSDESKIRRAVAENWKYSSMMMNHMKSLFGYEYFHFLQPNQYLEGSKPLSAEELQIAYAPGSHRLELVQLIFPELQRRGSFLQSPNFHFVDLTDTFKTTHETVYKDTCCHLNDLGNQMLAKSMVEHIVPVLAPVLQ